MKLHAVRNSEGEELTQILTQTVKYHHRLVLKPWIMNSVAVHGWRRSATRQGLLKAGTPNTPARHLQRPSPNPQTTKAQEPQTMPFRRQKPAKPAPLPNVEVIGLARIDTVSSIDSNATADNLPGAGRTVGLFFAWLGSRLEHALNKRAERFGFGPKAIADEIRRHTGRHETTFQRRIILRDRTLTESETRKVKKLCKALIRHAKYVAMKIHQSII